MRCVLSVPWVGEVEQGADFSAMSNSLYVLMLLLVLQVWDQYSWMICMSTSLYCVYWALMCGIFPHIPPYFCALKRISVLFSTS